MLHKTGWRIKQLISYGRKDTAGENGEISKIDGKLKRQVKAHSQISHSGASTDEEVLRRRNSTAATGAPPPPLPSSKNALSSASSRCRKNCDANIMSTPHSLSTTKTVLRTPKILCLGTEELPHNSGDARQWQLIFETQSRSLTPSLTPVTSPLGPWRTTSDSAIDLIKALTLHCDDGDKTSTQNISTIRNPESDDISENVERLIREADEAFKAVRLTLATTRAVSSEWCPTGDATTSMIAKDPSHTMLPRQFRAPIVGGASPYKLKRKKPPKHKSYPVQGSAPGLTKTPNSTSTRSLRLTATEVTGVMADIFSSKTVNHFTVDEVSVPGRICPLKAESRAELEAKCSSESTRRGRNGSTDETMTPMEPFHLEDLPSRMDAAGVSPADESPSMPPPPIPDRSKRRRVSQTAINTIKPHPGIQFNDDTFLHPPRREQRWSPSSQPVLPTIPEVSTKLPARLGESVSPYLVSTLTPLTPSRSTQSDINEKGDSGREAVLKSTPYSLTSFGFQHGTIRLNRHPSLTRSSRWKGSEHSNSDKSNNTVQDNGGRVSGRGMNTDGALDWTAFQTGDHVMDKCENIDNEATLKKEVLEQEIDEILEWWSGFRLDSGNLVQSDTAIEKPKPEEEGRKAQLAAAAAKAISSSHREGEEYESDGSLPPSLVQDFSPGALTRKGTI